MDNNEKKIVENLDYMTQNTEVPESLKPENIEKMLRDHQLEQKKPKKTFHWKRAYTRAAAAVVFLSVIGAAASALKVDRTAELVSDYVPGLDNGRKRRQGIYSICRRIMIKSITIFRRMRNKWKK